MNYNFDELIERKNTGCVKWDEVGKRVGNPDALPMWVADTDFRSPKPVLDAIAEKLQHGVMGYPAVEQSFFNSTVHWMAKRHGWQIQPDWVLFCTGVVPVLYTAVQAFTEPGDEVIIQRPVYYPFTNAIVDNGRVVSSNSLVLRDGKYEIDFEDLERRAVSPKAKLMILCSPHNPVSRVFTKEELLRVGEICLKHQVVLLSDEIHSDLIFSGHKHFPTASVSKEIADITLTATAPSKTFNTAGLRSAALIVSNPELRKKMAACFLRNKSAVANLFGLVAYSAAYEHGEEYLEQLLPYLEGNVAYVRAFLAEHMPKIKLVVPEGTYLLWLDCRELGLDRAGLDEFIINRSLVATDSGYWFGTEGEGFMRLNIGCPRTTVEQALNRILEQYQAHTF